MFLQRLLIVGGEEILRTFPNSLRQLAPVCCQSGLDIFHGFLNQVLVQEFSPVPMFTRKSIFFCKNLSDELADNEDARGINHMPTGPILVTDGKVGNLVEIRKVVVIDEAEAEAMFCSNFFST